MKRTVVHLITSSDCVVIEGSRHRWLTSNWYGHVLAPADCRKRPVFVSHERLTKLLANGAATIQYQGPAKSKSPGLYTDFVRKRNVFAFSGPQFASRPIRPEASPAFPVWLNLVNYPDPRGYTMKRLSREILAALIKPNSEGYKRGSPIRQWASAGVPRQLSRAPITSSDYGIFNDLRRIQDGGVRFLGLNYRSEKLTRLYKQVGRAHVRINVDLENLGTIWVAENRPGADWISVSCEFDMEGVSAAVWCAKVAALLRTNQTFRFPLMALVTTTSHRDDR